MSRVSFVVKALACFAFSVFVFNLSYAGENDCAQCHTDSKRYGKYDEQLHRGVSLLDRGNFSKKGADTCIKCHDEDNEYPVMPIFATKHGQVADKRTPFAGQQCEACHGPGAEHAKKPSRGEERAPILNFGTKSVQSVVDQNEKCLSCHQGQHRIEWRASAHEANDVACVSCHKIHVAEDPIMDDRKQTQVCVQCHNDQRASLYKASTHPLHEGKMNCGSCHQPHGSPNPALLKRVTTNQTCYECHAEKRGPFLWQHAPVEEDCSLCHQPHGSNHHGMLKARSALSCRQCHSAAGHPSLAPSATALPGGQHEAFGKFLVGKSCVNCHSKVHGSNHPSGVKFLR